MPFMEAKRLVNLGRRLVQLKKPLFRFGANRKLQIGANWCKSLFRFVLNICDDFLTRRNILATSQIARRTIKPFENNNKRHA